jgi:hypothetical protein
VRVPHHFQNHFLDALDIGEDVGVPIPNDPPAALLQPRRAPFVVFVVRVLATVGLDDEAAFETDEIDDEGTEAMLTAEFETA